MIDALASDHPPALAPPYESWADRRAAGRARRRSTPRSALAGWEPPPGRPDPVEVLIESNRRRAADLVPIRYGRMLVSPFGFLRGSALVMSLDLASRPSSGITVQLCGDAHLTNFGLFATPERRLVFDLNDFDETWPGPFEWDLERLTASAVVAARANGLGRGAARRAALAAAGSYCEWIDRYSRMHLLDVWYSDLRAGQLTAMMRGGGRRIARSAVAKAEGRTNRQAVARLTTVSGGMRRIVDDPPLVCHIDNEEVARQLPHVISDYRLSLDDERLALVDQYRLVDWARKVVGVGSVGTLCWILLMEGPNGGPLFLQAKQALVAGPEQAGLPGPSGHHGERVVRGQRRLQATSDILLGWATAPESGNCYYIRQLWDSKGSADVTRMGPRALRRYLAACGRALARAHARTGDSAAISGYVGRSSRFSEALVDFAEGYADQTERDYALLLAAAARGVIPVAVL
jgi:uncharacterized protein (DUF2252 family)